MESLLQIQEIDTTGSSMAFCFPRSSRACPHASGRRVGAANMTGELYEVGVAMFLFLKGMFETKHFFLDTNVDWAGAFDDVVFRFTDRSSHRQHTCLLQLKHKVKAQLSPQAFSADSGDFSLFKYFDSFCEIRGKLSERSEQNILLQGTFTDFEYVIYTNSASKQAKSLDSCSTSNGVSKILNSGGREATIFKFERESNEYKLFTRLKSFRETVKEISVGEFTEEDKEEKLREFQKLSSYKHLLKLIYSPEELDEALWEEFLQSLNLYMGQATEKTIQDKIKQMLNTYCGSHSMYTELKDSMIDWWRNGDYVLSDSFAPFWFRIMEKRVSSLVAPISTKLSKLSDLQFKVSENEWGRMTHIVTEDCIELTCRWVQQELSGVGHMFIEGSSLQTRLSEILALWQHGTWCKVLVLVGNAMCSEPLDVLRRCSDKRLIVISDTADNLSEFQNQRHVQGFVLNQLEEHSLEKILNCRVNFQGYLVTVRSLGDHTALLNSLTADTVRDLLSGLHTLKVGQELAVKRKVYIPRVLVRREYVSIDILSEEALCLAISGTSVQEIQQLLPIGKSIQHFENCGKSVDSKSHFIIEGVDEFNELSEIIDSIHWLHRFGKGFLWKGSKGEVYRLTKFLDKMAFGYSHEEVMKFPHQMVLIVAAPGTGKSTELNHMTSVIKNKNLTTWVVKIDLKEHLDHFKRRQPNALELLYQAGKFDTEMQKSLLRHQLYRIGNVIVMLDGFDEISPHYADKVIGILRELSNTKVRQIWLTSRPVMKDKLEQEFCTLQFSIHPLSGNEQINFLLSWWKRPKECSHDLKHFIKRLFDISGGWIMEIMSIPQHTTMIAEVFETEAQHFIETGEIALPPRLDLLQLYNKFVDRKWEVYFSKYKIDMGNVILSESYEYIKNLLQDNIMNCALVALLDNKDICRLHNGQEILKANQDFIEKFKSGHERTGIVIDVTNDKAWFVHRTFAEYFAAMWFSRNYVSNKLFLQNVSINRKFNVIQMFFDRFLAESYDLQMAVLNQDVNLVEELVCDQKQDVNSRDRGGKTALHHAVANCSSGYGMQEQNFLSIIEILLDNGADVGIKDKVLCWTPLKLAKKLKAVAVAKMLRAR